MHRVMMIENDVAGREQKVGQSRSKEMGHLNWMLSMPSINRKRKIWALEGSSVTRIAAI